jgi:hypothetical protein
MVVAALTDVWGKQGVHERQSAGNPSQHLDVDGGFEKVERQLNPGVHSDILETIEGFGIGEVANDVKGGKIHPIGEVDGLTDAVSESVNELVDISIDQRFLAANALLAEGRT